MNHIFQNFDRILLRSKKKILDVRTIFSNFKNYQFNRLKMKNVCFDFHQFYHHVIKTSCILAIENLCELLTIHCALLNVCYCIY